MDLKTIKLLASYNETTNKEMNKYISQINATQWNTDFKAYLPSIFKVCNHLYIGDFNWLKRFSQLRDFKYIKDGFFSREISFTMEAFKDPKEYIAKREFLDKAINKFVNELTENDLGGHLKYTDSRGTEHNRNVGGLIIHMFNHQTHHRGMISIYLEMLGIDNDYSNLLYLI
jgi:uncharacterized damage-inducible protein DinB